MSDVKSFMAKVGEVKKKESKTLQLEGKENLEKR